MFGVAVSRLFSQAVRISKAVVCPGVLRDVFIDIHVPKPYEFIGFGDIHGPKPYKFIGFGVGGLAHSRLTGPPKPCRSASIRVRPELIHGP